MDYTSLLADLVDLGAEKLDPGNGEPPYVSVAPGGNQTIEIHPHHGQHLVVVSTYIYRENSTGDVDKGLHPEAADAVTQVRELYVEMTAAIEAENKAMEDLQSADEPS